VEPVYGTVIQIARLIWRLQGLKITVSGVEHLPTSGGAVVAVNHTGYLDFTFAGLPAYKQGLGRKVRFMAKQEVFDQKITDRSAQAAALGGPAGRGRVYEAAVRMLKDGELVGVYPEATISRSFEIKEFKSGATRMAVEAGVPIVPHIVWGAQRIWTKDHPKKLLRPKVPITVLVGEPIQPTLAIEDLKGLLHSRMQHLLERAQEQYGPHPAGEFWVPRRLGGGAPSLAEASSLDAGGSAAGRRRARARRGAGSCRWWS
jgi:1-acyl-sn-glycerol-3-phosphate acyltransferase